MDRFEIVLAGLAAAKGAAHTPVQVQKLFFLVDRNIGDRLGGPFFDFAPYNYGPFDKAVYETLAELQTQGCVAAVADRTWTDYRLTERGQARGDALLAGMPLELSAYVQAVSEFVRRLSFSQLVSAIYRAYPEMRIKSLFQE